MIYYITVILASLISLLFIYYIYAFSYWKSRGVPYLPPKFPFGNFSSNVTRFTGQILADLYHQLKQNGYQYGGVYLFTLPIFILVSPEINKLVFMKNFKHFQDHGIHINLKKDKMAANLVTYTGEDWKKMRMNLAPAFAPSRVKMMFPLLTETCKDFDGILMEFAKKIDGFDVLELSSRYFTDVIGNYAFGIKCNCMQNPDAEFRHYGKVVLGQNFLNIVRLRFALTAPFFSRLFNINMFSPKATDFFLKVILETINYREENNIQRPDLLDSLIRLRNKENSDVVATKGMNDVQIAAQSFVFYLAGFETSSKIATYCMVELAINLDIQNKVRDELLQVLKQDGGVLTYEGIMKMKYLDKVVSETLRKHPVVLMIDRMCTDTFQIPETNIYIEKGTRTFTPILGLHMDPEFYPDPEKFDPERFSEEEISKRPPYTYLPFGEGPRICPGAKFGILQVKIFVTTMLKNFHYSLHPTMKMPLKTCTIANVLHPVNTLTLNVDKI